MNGFHWNERGELSADQLSEIDWLDHGFGTRQSSDHPAAGWPLATVKQIHSADVLDAAGLAGERGLGDGLTTNRAGLAVGIRTADCLPILLVDAEHRAVAAVHAGWRGSAAKIAERTIASMRDLYGTKPDQLRAAIGPGIGKCCFEVGPEVVRAFSEWLPELSQTEEKHLLDLVDINQRQLEAAGMDAENISHADLCTMDQPELFYSFRKMRNEPRRMVTWIAVRA